MQYRCVAIAFAFVSISVSCTSVQHHPEADRQLAAANEYLKQKQCELAEERVRIALEYGDYGVAYNLLGAVQFACLRELEDAIASFQRAISLDDDLAAAHSNLGAALLARTPPDYEEACEELRIALEIDPMFHDARENYGMCLARLERWRDARAQMIRLAELDPFRANAYLWLGYVDLANDNPGRAIEALRKCVELAPAHGACWLNLGRAEMASLTCEPAIEAFSRASGDPSIAPEARAGLIAAQSACAARDAAIVSRLDEIKKHPGDPAAHAELARIYRERGLIEEAEAEWESVVALDPQRCEAHYELALIADGRLDTARTIEKCREVIVCERLSQRSEDSRVAFCRERLIALR